MGVVMGVFVILLNTVVAPCLSMSHDPEKKKGHKDVNVGWKYAQ